MGERAQTGSHQTRVSALDRLGGRTEDEADKTWVPSGSQTQATKDLRDQIIR